MNGKQERVWKKSHDLHQGTILAFVCRD